MEELSHTDTERHSYTLLELKLLYEDLVEAKQQNDLDSRAEQLAATVHECCQMVVWGDKQNPDFFEFFLENKVLDLLFDMFARGRRRELLVSIISSLAKLVSNLGRQSLQLLLASGPLLSFQLIKFGQVTQDVAEYYVNFLKAVSQKLDEELVHLLFNQRHSQFPLAWQAIRFYNHPESMIRTTCRNIVLSLLKLREPHVASYLSSFPFVVFYSHLACFLREHWRQVNAYLGKSAVVDTEAKRAKLAETIEDHCDLVLFVEDAIRTSTAVGNIRVAYCVLNGLLAECLSHLYRTLTSNSRQQFEITFVVYALGIMLRNCSEPLLADAIMLLFFGRHQLKGVDSRLRGEYKQIVSYQPVWSFKHYWDSFDEELQRCSRDNYERATMELQARRPVKPQQAPMDLLGFESEETPAEQAAPQRLVFGQGNPKFELEYAKLASLYGLQGELTTIQLLMEVQAQLKGGLPLDLTQFEENSAKETLLSLIWSKDDILCNNALELLLAAMKCKHTSPEVRRYCGLLPSERSCEFYVRTTFEKLLKQCTEVLRLQPMTYRLCTLKNAAELISVLCKPYLGDPDMLTQQLRASIVLSLKLAVEKVKISFETHTDLVGMVHMFERAQQEVSRHRPKTFASCGILELGKEEETDLYEKFTYSVQQSIERDFHHFFLLKRLLEEIGVKPSEQYQFSPISEKDLQHSARFSAGKEVSVSNEHNMNCHYRLSEQDKPERRQASWLCSCLITLPGCMLLATVESEKSTCGLVRYNINYQSIVRISIGGKDNSVMRIKLAKGHELSALELLFEGFRGTTACKGRLEECRFRSAKFVFEQINTALNQSIQSCSVKAG